MSLPDDAPPSYDSGEKFSFNDNKTPTQTLLRSSPVFPPVKTYPQFVTRDKGKSRNVSSGWFNPNAGASSRTSHEVQNTVQDLLRDLVQEHPSTSAAAVGVLNSCAGACATHGVSFSDILQKQNIERHTPLYWAIVKRLPDDHPGVEENQDPDLLTALMSYLSPLRYETITDIRQACLAISDQNLFMRLRYFPGFARMSAVDQMLLGVKIPPDEIEVHDISPDKGVFAANFVIPQFRKRIAVSTSILLEFIVGSRLWRLVFFVAEKPMTNDGPASGSLCVSLSLQESSPPTHVDSRLLILQATPSPSTPAIVVRLQTSGQQLEVDGKQHQILGQLTDVGPKLQYANNPYTGSDENLRVRFEARLGKPDKESPFKLGP